jgi:membrane-associated protein
MAELLQQLRDVFANLFNSHELMAVLARPEMTVAAFIVLNLVIFIETGLLWPILPGDSLLVTAGLVAYNAGWNVPLLIGTLSAAAILGDTTAYWIGYHTGPRLFNREKSLLFRKDHLLAAQAFYERHGGKTIVLARFMPIVRTFAPVVAGIGRMNYRRFLSFNVFGGVGWVASMILLGYALTPFLDPLLKPVFGDGFHMQDHVEKVIVIVVLLSISPGIFAWARTKLRKVRPVADKMESAA